MITYREDPRPSRSSLTPGEALNRVISVEIKLVPALRKSDSINHALQINDYEQFPGGLSLVSKATLAPCRKKIDRPATYQANVVITLVVGTTIK